MFRRRSPQTAESTTSDPDLSRGLEELRRADCHGIAELLGSEAGRQAIRETWGQIDQALDDSASSKRIFAGIGQHSTRYYEVYPGEAENTFVVFVAALNVEQPGVAVLRQVGGQLNGQWRDWDQHVAFADPDNPAAPQVLAELQIRPVREGTSSFSKWAANPLANHVEEVLPMAHLQGMTDFDTDALRLSTHDDGQPVAGGLRFHTPQAPPERDFDDLAV